MPIKSGRESNPNFHSPKSADDIWVQQVVQVECADHGVVDEIEIRGRLAAAERQAQQTRESHWRDMHEGQRP